jgi:hypothetical protein
MSQPDHDAGTDWARLALDTRTALDLLGDYPPPCQLGGDGGRCHRDSEHAAANLGALRALIQDMILRLRPEDAPAVMLGNKRADSALHGGQHTLQRPPGAPPRPPHP